MEIRVWRSARDSTSLAIPQMTALQQQPFAPYVPQSAASHTMALTARPVRVLLVDDHSILREGLAALLGRDARIAVVAQASGGEEALALFAQHAPDVSLVDLRMSPMDGIELTKKLRELDPTSRVILLTTYDTDDEIFRGLRAGAASYLLKDVPFDSLVHTIWEVFSGRHCISPAIAAKLAQHVGQEELTARQLDVLRCLAKGMSNVEIGTSLYISEGTVKAHVKAILRKLAVRDRTQAVSIAMKRGLVRSE